MNRTNRRIITALAFVLAGGANISHAALISHWTFDSSMNDNVGSNNGTAVNGAFVSATSVIGGGALSLDGVNDYVNVGNDSSLNLTVSNTITMWVYGQNLGNTTHYNTGFYTRGDWNEGSSLVGHWYGPLGSAKLWSNYNVDGPVLSNGQWYQIAKTFDGSTAVYYINGKQVSSFAASAVTSNTNETCIGAEGLGAHGPRYFLGGLVDDVGVYDNALTATDMAIVNGLGRTGGIGLDQLGAAQALWSGNEGDTAVIGGATWQKVSGLSGFLGDWSGSVVGLDAAIVLDDSGNGIKVTSGGGGPGPLDHFVISGIASPQTVGKAITGISIVAKDAADITVTGFTGTVTYGGTAGVTGTSPAFTGGILSGLSVTPLTEGIGMTFSVDDGAGHVGSITFDVNPAPVTHLVSYWTFDADLSDSGPGGNTGTAVGNATVASTAMIGGGALSLDGNGDCVSAGSGSASTLNITGPITITMWVEASNLDGTEVNTGFYTRGNWNDGQSLLSLGSQSASPEKLWSNNNLEGGSLLNNAWHQIAKTYDGSTVRLYIDGKQVASGPYATGGTSTANATFIGAEGYGGGRWFLNGLIDDVGVYDNELDGVSMALINGLGRTGGIGLDQLDEAQALWAGNIGDTTTIGGITWQKVSDLTGSLGDWSGTVAVGDAFIVLDGAGNGIQVAVAPPAGSYAAWEAEYPTADLSDKNADYDGDGMSNFQEYAFGLNPTIGTSVNPITDVSELKSDGFFTYLRRKGSGLTYTVYLSTDLGTWAPDNDTNELSVVEDPQNPKVEAVTISLGALPTSSKFFVRVAAN